MCVLVFVALGSVKVFGTIIAALPAESEVGKLLGNRLERIIQYCCPKPMVRLFWEQIMGRMYPVTPPLTHHQGS